MRLKEFNQRALSADDLMKIDIVCNQSTQTCEHIDKLLSVMKKIPSNLSPEQVAQFFKKHNIDL